MPYNFVPESFYTAVMAKALRAKIYRKWAILHQRGHFDQKFLVQGVAPHQQFLHSLLSQWMPYNFAADSFHTKKLCSRLSSNEVHFLMKIGRFAFLRPPLGNLGATYDDHLRLIGKRVVDFLLASIELFSLGVTAEELRAIIGWKSAILLQRGPVDPKYQVEGVTPHQPFFFSEN